MSDQLIVHKFLSGQSQIGESKEFWSEFQQICRRKEALIEAALAENIFSIHSNIRT